MKTEKENPPYLPKVAYGRENGKGLSTGAKGAGVHFQPVQAHGEI